VAEQAILNGKEFERWYRTGKELIKQNRFTL
jgi:hypothetical protein